MFNKEQINVYRKLLITIPRWVFQDYLGGKNQKLTIVGDSHTRYFCYMAKHHPLEHTMLRVFNVTGATASGLANPNSKTRAVWAFKTLLRRVPDKENLLIQLGEVDCGFVIWMRAANLPEACQHADAVLERYLEFVQWTKKSGFQNIYLSTVSPPTISDWSGWRGPVAHMRRQVTAGIEDRAALTCYFNSRLRMFSGDDYKFLDVEDGWADQNGYTLEPFVCETPGDLHLANAPSSEILREGLVKLGL